MKKYLYPFFFTWLCLACIDPSESPPNGISFDGTGYKPIYATEQEVAKIEIAAARPLANPGKIYVFGPYLFINESGKGIHVINNEDPAKPENLSFISINGNYDIAVKGNWLYADNLSNLLVFDITDPKAPKLSKTIANALPVNNFPPFRNVYFECADTKNGIVVGWEKAPMPHAPKCFR